MIKILGNRILVCAPEKPIHPEMVANGKVDFVEYGLAKILIPTNSSHEKNKKASEWEILAIGNEGRSGKPDELLEVGQHVLVDNTMGYQAYEHEGKPCRIYSTLDALCIVSPAG